MHRSNSFHFTSRLRRSLENPLRFIHRSNADFFVLRATGNVYTVTLSTTPTCTCPDPFNPCKHILFVYIRVLSLSQQDPCLRRHTLSPSELTRLLSAEVSDEALAGESTRERFHELYHRRNATKSNVVKVEDGCTCPVCLAVLGVDARKVVACAKCSNAIHEECLMSWYAWKTKGSRVCVICIAKWRDIGEKDGYINLSAYVSEDESEDDRMDDEEDEEESEDEEEIPSPVEERRGKAKASVSGFATAQNDIGQQIVEQMKQFNLYQKERVDMKRRQEEREDFKILALNIDHLHGPERVFLENTKKDLKEKYVINDV